MNHNTSTIIDIALKVYYEIADCKGIGFQRNKQYIPFRKYIQPIRFHFTKNSIREAVEELHVDADIFSQLDKDQTIIAFRTIGYQSIPHLIDPFNRFSTITDKVTSYYGRLLWIYFKWHKYDIISYKDALKLFPADQLGLRDRYIQEVICNIYSKIYKLSDVSEISEKIKSEIPILMFGTNFERCVADFFSKKNISMAMEK